ncbi:uncharacterized protein DNG_10381 [Cephalotrichum gorgonifer]|uniref:Autophagy-related protein 14 n=1 Tax=Cephalotrichum gorgonifer TaxID=2041049 RepID=A0AAE8N7I3_9PEZI|nr:uncharacterized protein DNG_10381 [Cephalotrichum gorgonifer]
MNCDICQRPHHTSRLPFLCAVDARNVCYDGRVRTLQVLLKNEELQNRISDLVTTSTGEAGAQSTGGPSQSPAKSAVVESLVSQRALSEDRTNQILAQAEKLRLDIAAARNEIKAKRETNARRKSDLVSASSGIESRRAKALDSTEKSIHTLRNQWNRSSDRMAATRAFLCMEAAKLYGLRRLKKGSSRYEFKLGGIEVVDLASMNALSPEFITTSLAHTAHILILASHYLSIRLPAEITMPHRDHPRPTIFAPMSSYQQMDSGSRPVDGNPIPSLSNQGRNSDAGNTARPRPLFVDRPLSVLAKEDPSTYSFFLEGVTLLAYDVAWACLSQNVPIGDRSSFEDVCNMGRNLYNLLIGQQLHSNQTAKIYPSVSAPESPSDGDDLDHAKPTTAALMMGRYSHGTAHKFLGSAAGTEFVRSFKLPAPIKLADRLKRKLTSELSVPEWEVVENGDWEVEEA